MNKSNWLMPPNEWQFVDPTNGFIFPWITLDFLEYLITLDISEWRIFESGGGAGTLWWASKCKEVVTLENNKGWLDKISSFAREKGIGNITFKFVETDKFQRPGSYLDVLEEQTQKFDAIVIDGLFRDTMAIMSVNHIKENGLLIADNYQQEEIWAAIICSQFLNDKYPIRVYKQSPILNPEEHPWVWEGNSRYFAKLKQGHPHWKTACWEIKK